MAVHRIFSWTPGQENRKVTTKVCKPQLCDKGTMCVSGISLHDGNAAGVSNSLLMSLRSCSPFSVLATKKGVPGPLSMKIG
jgi:hypothetical protein